MSAFLILFVFLSCAPDSKDPVIKCPDSLQENPKVSYQIWDELLKKHVSEEGKVSYQGFLADRQEFKKYLRELTCCYPNESWTENERKAYWINVYNAFTIDLILMHYPVESIKDIGGMFVTPWDIEFFEIEGKKMDLTDVEHGILRKEFNDPRIHFAINCASFSCPRLKNGAYFPDSLDEQLDEAAKLFINNSQKNKIGEEKVEVSKIFHWFSEDFTRKGKLVNFLNKYAETKIKANASIGYMDYNWNLNE